MLIRVIGENETKEATELVLRVFMQFEAPDYSDEGVEAFKKTVVYNKDYIDSITMYGAYVNDKIVGVIATRNNGSHIALFFVDSRHHRKGIGRMLLQTVFDQNTSDEITVNSSPYAKEVYLRLGFEAAAGEQDTDGIRYIPMIYKKKTCGIAPLIAMLEDKDTSAAYKALQELEHISDASGSLYPYTEKFADMISSDKYVVRVRGFRLFCRQAKWDRDNILDENIDAALYILNDIKPTAVRQALAALSDVVRFKPDLRQTVKKAVAHINYLQYKDSMQGLIVKDIQVLLVMMEKSGEWA